MCNLFSFFNDDSITIEMLDDANKKIFINYMKCRNREIAYWEVKEPKYAKFLSTQPYNICNKSYYYTLLHYANLVYNMKPFIAKADICISILLAFYNISLYETQEYVHHKRLLKGVDNINHVQNLYYEICGISITSTNPDNWSDDNSLENEDSTTVTNPIHEHIFNNTMYHMLYDHDVYKELRHFMITGGIKKTKVL